MLRVRLLAGSALALSWVAGCKDAGPATDSDVGTEPVCEALTEVACFDDMLVDLSLQTDVSDGAVSNEADGNDWVSEVDATAGGFEAAASNPWVYLRFTDAGLERVDIDDLTSLDSMDWHLAAHRFKLRLNGGSGGPSCVTAAPLVDGVYAEVTLADAEGATFFEDDFYTASCDLINDSSGLPGSPQVALGPWWSYPGCVATTGTPFLVRLDTGRILKLEVEKYYSSGQNACNSTGAAGSGSGEYTFRWSFLN